MTGLIILTFVPFLVALGFMIRLRAERAERAAEEQRMALLEQQLETDALIQQRWNAAFTHELRSPLAAVLGYTELLEDGALGPIDDRAVDAVRRIRAAADELLHIVEGVETLALAMPQPPAPPQTVDARALLYDAADALRYDADTRGTSLSVRDVAASFTTSPDDAARALRLALGAAIKATPDGTLTLTATPAPDPALIIAGTALHTERDHPDTALSSHLQQSLTGAAFRLALARQTAQILGGTLTLEPDGAATTVILRIPG